MNFTTGRLAVGLLLFGLAAGCGGCKERSQPKTSPVGYFPKAAPMFFEVQDPEKLGIALRRLDGMKANDLARLTLGAREDEDLLEPLVQQLGFDPRGQEGFALAGIDRNKPIAAGTDEEGRRLLVVGVSNKGAASRWIAELAKKQRGLTKTERVWEAEEGARKLRIPAYLGSSGAVRVAYVIDGDWLVAAEGKEAVEALGIAVSRKEGDSLAGTRSYATAKERIGEGRTVWGWMPGEKKKKGMFGRGASFGLTLDDETIGARLRIPQGTIELSVLQAAANQVAGKELLPFLSQDDFFTARIGGDPLALQPLLQAAFPRTFRQLRRAGIDPSKEILAHFHPGVVMGLSLEPEPNLSGGLPVQPSLSTTNPFHFVHSGFVARVKDPEEVRAALEKLSEVADKLKMKVEAKEEEGLKVYSASYHAGDGLTWALVGDKLIAAGGEGAFEKLLERVQEGPPSQAPSAGEIFDSGASAAHLDMKALVSQLRAIPESSFGIGGFRLKEVMNGWIAMLEEIESVTVAFHVDGDGVVLDTKVGIE